MIPEEWSGIKNFNQNENWGDPSKIQLKLVSELDRFRSFLDRPMIVTCGTQGAHVQKSVHYEGLAVDVMFPWASKQDLFNILLSALRFGFMGIGVYGDWHHRGQEIGGLHLDMRSADYRALWVGLIDQSLGGRVYRPLTGFNLKAAGIL